MSVDPRELARLRTFYVGQIGSDDLRAAFVIDGRDYAAADAVRADLHAAVAELHDRRLPAQFVTRPVRQDEPRSGLPGWRQWASTRTRMPSDHTLSPGVAR